jgi:hypothetical protein
MNMNGIQIKDWITIIAMIVGPILALQVQKLLERYLGRKEQQLSVFRTLMATRAARVSHSHVEALNMIDIVFYDKWKYDYGKSLKLKKNIIEAWRVYNDHLNNKDGLTDEQWAIKGDDLFFELLCRMSNYLKYDFDKVLIRRGCYSPIAHDSFEHEVNTIRKGLFDVFTKGNPIPLYVVNLQPDFVGSAVSESSTASMGGNDSQDEIS